jgi:hypothetical protein
LSLPPLRCVLAIEQKLASLFTLHPEKCPMSLPMTITASFADGHRDRRWWVLAIVVAAQFIFCRDRLALPRGLLLPGKEISHFQVASTR